MKTSIINQTVIIPASPKQVYEIFMDEKLHSQITGGPVTMSIEKDGKFEVFGGYCHGVNLELEPGKRIVQLWHFSEDGWPDDHYSICTFQFEEHESGTRLIFSQSGVPTHKVESLEKGWETYYWTPIKNIFVK